METKRKVEKKKFIFSINPDIHKLLKILAVQKDKTISDTLTEIILKEGTNNKNKQ